MGLLLLLVFAFDYDKVSHFPGKCGIFSTILIAAIRVDPVRGLTALLLTPIPRDIDWKFLRVALQPMESAKGTAPDENPQLVRVGLRRRHPIGLSAEPRRA